MARVLFLWNEWEVHILVLVSFMLQVLLLTFARMRRRSISQILRILLWLMYLLADTTAIYTLGHMSISCKPDEHHKLMAFWAPFLLVHLGGQDTITAYSMEDNQLWLRHALTFFVQALGTIYVLYKNIGRQWPLTVAAAIMFLAGVLKIWERVWALSSSSLESISNLLDNVDIRQKEAPYSARAEQMDAEVVLQGAHDLLYICMGQFVDDIFWPTKFQMDAIRLFHEKGSTFELIEMQLSLMYDIFYTKARVIHTWWGCCTRAVLLFSTATTFFLFHFIAVKDRYIRVDVVVTYILLAGASLLEVASVLRAMWSTWTCNMFKSRGWNRLHRLLVSLRRSIGAAQTERWSGSIGQHDLVDSCLDDTRRRGSSMASFLEKGSSIISADTKKLVLGEIERMVQACEGKVNRMRRYRGQCVLQRYEFMLDLRWCTDMEFDDSILSWHLATHEFLRRCNNDEEAADLVNATEALSNYMMFLFVERPYMLPPPVRPRLYDKAREELLHNSSNWMRISPEELKGSAVVARAQGVLLAEQLLTIKNNPNVPLLQLLKVVFGVWVEMLCYAAHHCSRDSHARQLNSGGDFITIVWLLTTAVFNHAYCQERWFKERVHYRNRWRCSFPLSWRYRWQRTRRWLYNKLLFPCSCMFWSCLLCMVFCFCRDRLRRQ